MYVHTMNYYYSDLENNKVLTHAAAGINFERHYAELKKPDTKEQISYGFNLCKMSRMDNQRGRK